VDNLDRFNEAVSNIAVSWRNVFVFVAFVYVVGTIFAISGGSAVSWIIISWIIIAIIAALIYFRKGESKAEPEEMV